MEGGNLTIRLMNNCLGFSQLLAALVRVVVDRKNCHCQTTYLAIQLHLPYIISGCEIDRMLIFSYMILECDSNKTNLKDYNSHIVYRCKLWEIVAH